MHVEPPKKSFRPSRPNDTEPSEEQANFANKNITTLPDELLVKIFSNLDTRNLLNCQLVNRRWQELIDDHMLALVYYRRCHPAEQRISPLTVERYHSFIQGWLRGFSNLGRESAAQLDKFLQHKHFTERLFFSITKVLAKAKALTCQDVGTITHSNSVGKARFSPDGNYLVTVSNYCVKISELVAGKWQDKVTIQHLYRVRNARFSPDGKRLVTASYDMTAKIWELEGGQWREKNTLQHSDRVIDAFFSPDGSHLVTASNDRAAIWGLFNGHWQEKIIIQHSGPVEVASFSPDGKHLVLSSYNDNMIWGPFNGQWQPKATIETSGLVINTSFSPDGTHLVTTSDFIAKIWLLKSKENDDSC